MVAMAKYRSFLPQGLSGQGAMLLHRTRPILSTPIAPVGHVFPPQARVICCLDHTHNSHLFPWQLISFPQTRTCGRESEALHADPEPVPTPVPAPVVPKLPLFHPSSCFGNPHVLHHQFTPLAPLGPYF